ncbi:MAG TPA: Xaa-Pro peptidase family protein [Gaiellales bacterium]
MTASPSAQPVASADELIARRRRLLDGLPADALVLVRGALPGVAMQRFRQSNDFLYLTGLAVPGAYLLLDAQRAHATVYVAHRDARREGSDGPMLAAEDADVIAARTGAAQVSGVERLAADLAQVLIHAPRPVYLPLAPEEVALTTRDSALAAAVWAAADPFGDVPDPAAALAAALTRRFPQLEVRDLSPMLDALRLRKSASELEHMREAGRLCGLAVMEAMRSTAPGVYEHELEAVANFVFRQGAASGPGYEAIIAGGDNAWYAHYNANDAALADGDLVLMDYAPDYRGYTSDIGRMWPVGGRYSDAQRELYGFVLDYHAELLARIEPGRTPDAIMDDAAAAMRARIAATRYSKAIYATAVEQALEFRGHLSHSVGMAVHDVGSYLERPLEPGLVFAVDPMIWVPEERLYVRVEDTVAVTGDGIENLTGFVPLAMDDVERLQAEPGLLQWWASNR